MTIKEIIQGIQDSAVNDDFKNSIFLCPFHQEKTPSFTVRDGIFRCFGCKLNGDLSDFMALIEDQINSLLATSKQRDLSEKEKLFLKELLEQKTPDIQQNESKKAQKTFDELNICHKIFADERGGVWLSSKDCFGNSKSMGFDRCDSIESLNRLMLWNEQALTYYNLQESTTSEEAADRFNVRANTSTSENIDDLIRQKDIDDLIRKIKKTTEGAI